MRHSTIRASIALLGSGFLLLTLSQGCGEDASIPADSSSDVDAGTKSDAATVVDASSDAASADASDASTPLPTYAVKGVVKSLYGTGLLLANGADQTAVAPGTSGADVAFALPTKLASGATFAITVAQAPSSPSQTCEVTSHGSGTIADSDIADIVVTCSCPSGSVTLNATGALQTFAPADRPSCVTAITIDAYGAEGGTSTGEAGGQSLKGGLGARAKGTFTVAATDTIDVLVGKRGGDSNCGSGGGGGSFATRAGTLLLAAGGGGGGFHCTALGGIAGGSGLATTNGADGVCIAGRPVRAGGTSGNGGSAYFGGGGGGWLTAGTSSFTGASNAGGAYPGAGGVNGGGYGGGGGYYPNCCGGSGGGGGFSGGSGDANDGCAGGGGGSYNTGTTPTTTSGVRSGDGQVVISW